MDKKKLATMIALLTIAALPACSNAKISANTSEMEGYDDPASDLLVDTLEYILSDDEEKDEDFIKVGDDGTEQTDDEEDKDQVEAVIYYGNGASDKLNSEISTMEELTAENLIGALAGHNIVPLGTKVNYFEVDETDGKKVLLLDLDKAFREYLKTMNEDSEKIILASVTATFLEAYNAESITITIDDKVLETNHETYDEPFEYNREYIETPAAVQ